MATDNHDSAGADGDPEQASPDNRVDSRADTEPDPGADEPESAMAPTVPIPHQVEVEVEVAPEAVVPAVAAPPEPEPVAVAAAPPEPAAATPAPAAHKKRPLLRARFVLIGLLLVGLAAYVMLNAERWIHEKTIEQARLHGIELKLGSVNLDWDRVQLKHFEFTLVGVGGVHGYVELLQIDLDELEPTRVGARGVRLDVEGSAAALAMTISEWTKNYPGMMIIPAKASAVDVTWRPQPGEPEWLLIEDAVIEPTVNGGSMTAKNVRVFDIDIGFDDAKVSQHGDGASVTATGVRVAGVDLGSVGTSWSGDSSQVTLGFGEEDPANAPVTIEVAYAPPAPKATIILKPTALERLAAPLGVALPIEGVTASGTADLRFGSDPTRGAIEGSLQGTFEGYSPPVPKEVSSFVFGKTTHLRTKLAISGDRKRVELSETHVEHGAFKLDGGGLIERHDTHATIGMDMEGKLRCTDLADAAARAQVGGVMGSFLGGAARFAVKGSVAIKLKIEADSRNLAAAKLDKTIGIGCGLKSLGELPIPKLPAGFPPLPELPSFDKKHANDQP